MRHGLAALLLVLVAGGAGAQEPREMPDVPRDVQERIREMQDDPDARRLTGPIRIAPGQVERDVVVDGTLTLEGRVEGDLLVTRGDLILGSGAVVTGDVLVVGGAIEGAEHATVGGTMLSFGPARRGDYVDRDDEDEARDDDDWQRSDDDDDDRRWRHRHRDENDGGIDVGLSIAGNYNRVEGLPVMFGPVIRSAGPNRFTLYAQAIWRSEASRSLDDEIGYRVRAQQGLFEGQFLVGGDVASMVRPIERRGLNSTESGLAAALFHSDLHDYYDEESWAVHVELRPEAIPLEARLEYRDAEHDVLEVSDPWSLLEGDDPWRAQPVVAVGDISTLLVGVTLDTRDDDDRPLRGFLGSVTVEHALDQDLVMPGIDLGGTVGGGFTFEDVTTASVDVRGYLPVNRSSMLGVRGFAAGSIDEAVLPPQFQRALGGIGTLPGFPLFQGACGARDARVRLVRSGDPVEGNELSEETMLGAYGCDRVLLGQLEYRGGFELGVDEPDHEDEDDDHDHHWRHVDMSADWTFFVDVARGWSYGDMTFVDRGDTETMADVGLGLLFDEVGVYVAMPVTGDDQSLRAVVRLQHRF